MLLILEVDTPEKKDFIGCFDTFDEVVQARIKYINKKRLEGAIDHDLKYLDFNINYYDSLPADPIT